MACDGPHHVERIKKEKNQAKDTLVVGSKVVFTIPAKPTMSSPHVTTTTNSNHKMVAKNKCHRKEPDFPMWQLLINTKNEASTSKAGSSSINSNQIFPTPKIQEVSGIVSTVNLQQLAGNFIVVVHDDNVQQTTMEVSNVLVPDNICNDVTDDTMVS